MDTTAGDVTEPSGLSPIFGSKGNLVKDIKNGALNLAKKSSSDLDLAPKTTSDRLSADGTSSKPSASPITRDLVIRSFPSDPSHKESQTLGHLYNLFGDGRSHEWKKGFRSLLEQEFG